MIVPLLLLSLRLAAFISRPRAALAGAATTTLRDRVARSGESIELSFRLSGRAVRLNLTRNPFVRADVPVYVRYGKRVRQVYLPRQDVALYADKHREASFSVQRAGRRRYRGSFVDDGEEYVIEPATSASRHRRSNGREKDIYVIRRRVREDEQANARDFETRFDNRTVPPMFGDGGRRRGRIHNVVELLLVVDYSIYKTAFDSLGCASGGRGSRRVAALNRIRFYYSHVINGVDLRYSNIEDPRFSVRVKLASLYVATSPEESPWTSGPANFRRFLGANYTSVYGALDDFERWLGRSKRDFPSFDQASLVTGYEPVAFENNDFHNQRRAIQGLANIGGICDFAAGVDNELVKSVSINKEKGQYSTTMTIAHELGHNLGARHDNHRTPDCPSSEQFVMAANPAVLSDQNFNNPYRFSACSIDTMYRQILALTEAECNCLFEKQDDPEAPNDEEIVLPGQKFLVNQQCEWMHGPGARYCGAEAHDPQICRQIHCFDPFVNQCVTETEKRAFDGTTCGSRKWCIRGKCVRNDKAATSENDYCIHGDYAGVLPELDETCPEAVKQRNWRCYDLNFRNKCCESCAKIADGTQDCLYGDRVGWCSERSSASLCSGPPDRRRTCCGTCSSRRRPAVSACASGDKSVWCGRITRAQCYRHGEHCCASCRKHATGMPGCAFGDRSRHCSRRSCAHRVYQYKCCHTCAKVAGLDPGSSSSSSSSSSSTTAPETRPDDECQRDSAGWCRNMKALFCYNRADRSTCCSTCAKHFNQQHTGCEYGDSVSWCADFVKSLQDCAKSNHRWICCETCRKIGHKKSSNKTQDYASWCPRYYSQCSSSPIVRETCPFTCQH